MGSALSQSGNSECLVTLAWLCFSWQIILLMVSNSHSQDLSQNLTENALENNFDVFGFPSSSNGWPTYFHVISWVLPTKFVCTFWTDWWMIGKKSYFRNSFEYLLSRSKYFWVVDVLSGANFSAQERLQKIWTFSVHTIKCCQLFVYCPVEMVEMENIQTIADSVTFLDTSKWE